MVPSQIFNRSTASSKKDNPFPPFPCPFCERAYTSWGFRRRHVKAMHTQSERLTCKWCPRVTDTHSQWESHVSSEHGLSPTDAHNGILILDEANMVLRIPNPPRLDTLVSMTRGYPCGSATGAGFQCEETLTESVHYNAMLQKHRDDSQSKEDGRSQGQETVVGRDDGSRNCPSKERSDESQIYPQDIKIEPAESP